MKLWTTQIRELREQLAETMREREAARRDASTARANIADRFGIRQSEEMRSLREQRNHYRVKSDAYQRERDELQTENVRIVAENQALRGALLALGGAVIEVPA